MLTKLEKFINIITRSRIYSNASIYINEICQDCKIAANFN